MIKGDYDYLKDLASRNVCSEHGTPLEIAWHSGEKTWVLRCGHDHYPDAIIRSMSLTEEYKAGLELPGHIEDNVKKGRNRRAMQQSKQPTAVTFSGVPATDLGTGELLLPETIKALVDYAQKYNLDPYRGHVVLMYSKPYITIDGYLYHAHRQHIPFTILSRPLKVEERPQYLVNEGDHAWVSEVRITEAGLSFPGLGIVTKEEMEAKSSKDQTKLRSPVVAAHPWQLAQKRAEWQALRRAFPIGESEEVKNEA